MSDDSYGAGDDFDDEALAMLADLEQVYTKDPVGYAARKRTDNANLVQLDLYGGQASLVNKKMNAKASGSSSRTGSGAKRAPEPAHRVVKIWDRGSFAEHGWSKKSAALLKKKRSGKKKDWGSDEEGWDEERVEDDDNDPKEIVYLDENYDPNAAVVPIQWPPDEEQSLHWHYPVQADKPLRTYQYNIIHNALFENTLVSLPTGLGKTFIAAVVMLNFYRWYPQGKIIFMAPTRPLVTQQIQACHYIAGIPQTDCVELTGQTSPSLRGIAWSTKRVVYCTPQTVENDLAKGRLNPRDVVLIVVDEAHRASGDYAYCGVVRYMMSKNPNFRLLALTATPGSNLNTVQAVVDNLHIGKVEIRTDNSLDISTYIHKKSYDLCIIQLGPVLSALRDRFGALMKGYMQPLIQGGLLHNADPISLHPYTINQIFPKLKAAGKGSARHFTTLKILGSLARAMEYLLIQSVSSFLTVLKDLAVTGPQSLRDNATFKQVLADVEQLRARPDYIGHPKMEELSRRCIEHFNAAAAELDEAGQPTETRIMVFCNYRAVVDEIVSVLNWASPMIKATAFVGQANAKGSTGVTQKGQIETIKKYKRGVFNVLVATSIGEEGLDIGEIDLIVCYEANKSPIRMLQRVGRTGRARDGKIIVFMTESREEKNWKLAQDAYTQVQHAIVTGSFELYADGERMLPRHIKPQVAKVVINALPLDMSTMTMVGAGQLVRRKTAEEKKAKKLADAKKNIPVGATLGFKTAKKMVEEEASSTQIVRERKVAALLTASQEEWLRETWQDSGRLDKPPRRRDNRNPLFDPETAGPTIKLLTHSSRHEGLLALRRMFTTLSASDEAEQKWVDRTADAFSAPLVHWWHEARRGTGASHHQLFPRALPSSPELGESMAYSTPPLSDFSQAPSVFDLADSPIAVAPLALSPNRMVVDSERHHSLSPIASPMRAQGPPLAPRDMSYSSPERIASSPGHRASSAEHRAPPSPTTLSSSPPFVVAPPSRTISSNVPRSFPRPLAAPQATRDYDGVLSSDEDDAPRRSASIPRLGLPVVVAQEFPKQLPSSPVHRPPSVEQHAPVSPVAAAHLAPSPAPVAASPSPALLLNVARSVPRPPVPPKATLDYYGVLSSDEDDAPRRPAAVVHRVPQAGVARRNIGVARAGVAAGAGAAKVAERVARVRPVKDASSDYDMDVDLDQDALDLLDALAREHKPVSAPVGTTTARQPLQPRNGPALQRPPIPAGKPPAVVDDDLVIEDSEDEGERLPAATAPRLTSSLASAPRPSPLVVVGAPALLAASYPAPAPVRAPQPTAEDSFFGADDGEFEAALLAADSAHLGAGPEDQFALLPKGGPMLPPLSIKRPTRKAGSDEDKVQQKKRPRHHIIPDSDSSAQSSHIKSARASRGHGLDESSPDVVGGARINRRRPPSSPNDARAQAGPSRAILQGRNPLQRGRPEPISGTGDGGGGGRQVEAGPFKIAKGKGPKRKKLNNQGAMKTGLFVLEAVNSSEPEPAPSSGYDTEDSDDRRFVAGDNSQESGEEDMGRMAQFYRDSLNTQPPAGFGVGVFGHRQARPRVAHSVETGTPREGSQWSINSFCVADDEEIEEENSSSFM